MKITDVKIRQLLEDSGRLKAMVSITLDDALAVHDIKIIEGDERLFVAMPSKRDENRGFRDIVHPIDSASRAALEDAVLFAYRMRRLELSAEQDARMTQYI